VSDPAERGEDDGRGGAAEEDPLGEALALGLRHLARREHTVAQLRARLRRAGVESAVAEEAIAQLVEQRALDDARYARLLAEDRRTLDGWGADRIRAALEAAGVAAELIDAALAGFDGESELAAATALARRRHPQPIRTDAERQRVFAMLVRRGYDSEIAYAAVREAARDAG
jgi:regulatory protein